MKLTSRFITLMLGSTGLLFSTHGAILANQVQSPIVSAGAETTTNGSFLNIGQSVIGAAISRSHGMHAGGIPVIQELLDRQPLGDMDDDGDVDHADHALFADCMNGPDVSVPPRGCSQEQFELADFEGDNDVDLADYNQIATAFFAE